MYRESGISPIIGIFILLVFMPIAIWLPFKMGTVGAITEEKTDGRGAFRDVIEEVHYTEIQSKYEESKLFGIAEWHWLVFDNEEHDVGRKWYALAEEGDIVKYKEQDIHSKDLILEYEGTDIEIMEIIKSDDKERLDVLEEEVKAENKELKEQERINREEAERIKEEYRKKNKK